MTLWTTRTLRVIEALPMRQAYNYHIEKRSDDSAQEKTKNGEVV